MKSMWLSATILSFFAMAGSKAAFQAAQPKAPETSPAPKIERRPLVLTVGNKWIGAGVSYGPFRDGQSPKGVLPTAEQIREDLHIMARHWGMLRMYGSRGATDQVCQIIHEEKLPLKVMVGAWIAPEGRTDAAGKIEELPEVAKENEAEVDHAIALAKEYPDVVLAVSIGNETQVSWSDHLVPAKLLIRYIRKARAAVSVPVATCDDFNFWNKAESREVAAECDFLGTHHYAMWNKQQLSDALNWTRQTLSDIRSVHPGVPLVITEIGWATSKGTEGYQAVGIVSSPNERDQELFFRSLRDWATGVGQPYFYFCAFDENWKGGANPSEVEKNWGVYKADRTPKLTFQDSQPSTANK